MKLRSRLRLEMCTHARASAAACVNALESCVNNTNRAHAARLHRGRLGDLDRPRAYVAYYVCARRGARACTCDCTMCRCVAPVHHRTARRRTDNSIHMCQYYSHVCMVDWFRLYNVSDRVSDMYVQVRGRARAPAAARARPAAARSLVGGVRRLAARGSLER